jgi:hypothetical protein
LLICVVEDDKTVADVPLKSTVLSEAVALKFVPVIVIVVPTIPVAGAKLVIVGSFVSTVKSVAEITVQIKSLNIVVTKILPEVAPAGTIAII